ncbi:kinase-like protein [Phlegmacium glaucopus]|nr:kinase-like protein [Phlegmacium glaucopus]
MENSFRYVFIETKSWFMGPSHSSLSFSSDGTTIAGSMPVNSPNYIKGKVQFWDTATGAPTSSFNDCTFVVFSPTDPDMTAIMGSDWFHMAQRDSPGGRTWSLIQGKSLRIPDAVMSTFRSDGKTMTVVAFSPRLCGVDSTNFTPFRVYVEAYHSNVTSIASCPLEPDSFIVVAMPTHPSRVSACAWSQDRKWIATGDKDGDIRLWDARATTIITLATNLPPYRFGVITPLIFLADSTALIILGGSYLTVWDIAKGVYVENSGLPAMAMNVLLDGPRNRVAVAVDDMIFFYELKLPQQRLPAQQKLPQQRLPVREKLPQQMLPGQQKLPHHNRQSLRNGKPSIPSELAEFDITTKVMKSKPGPFVNLYFDIYRGVWNFDTPRVLQHAVTIKALRSAFNPRRKTQERQDFEDLFTGRLVRWSNLSHDNLLPLLGFGRFPAIITSWTTNGLLSEYIKSDEEYDKMQLVVGVARGVAYLHSEDIVHSDIRGSSFLVDELGNARLADPGLHSVLINSPLIASGTLNVSYRWMAPELLKNSSAKATFATDVYSVTMTSLEIFTASDPFDGDSDALVASQVLQNQRPERPEDIDDILWSLWSEGWNRDAAKRPDMESYVNRLAQLV